MQKKIYQSGVVSESSCHCTEWLLGQKVTTHGLCADIDRPMTKAIFIVGQKLLVKPDDEISTMFNIWFP